MTVTDANGCTDTETVTITEPLTLVASASIDNNVYCNNDSTGQATANATGGTMPYSYLWSNGQDSATALSLSAGNYVVTITDNNGCFDTSLVTITEPTALIAGITLDSNASCFGTSTGAATAFANGGVGPYFYNWSHGPTGASVDALSAGIYSVVILDQNGCLDTTDITISEPTLLTSTAVQVSAVNCFNGNDGSAAVSPIGGTMPYAYAWSNGETADTATNLSVGTNYITITDANGCSYIDSVVTTQPNTPITTNTAVLNNVLCNADTSALAAASAVGGTSPYAFAWSNGANTDTASFSAGTWYVTITDANGCFELDSIIVTEPNALVATIDSTNNISCFGLTDGEAFASATGGTTPYSYAWNSAQTTASISGQSAGAYQITITDANGCFDTASSTVIEPDSISNIFTIADVSCNGGSDGYMIANPVGGTGAYSYAWNNSATTDSIGGLSADFYSVTITDANLCSNVFVDTVSEPTLLVASATVISNVLCNGDSSGSAFAIATGGTSPYTFNWPSAFTANTDTVFGLPAGNHIVTVLDANLCSTTASVTITEPNAIVITADSVTDVNCVGGNDGYINVSALGGVGTYSFSWSNGATTSNISNLTAGVYCVTVTDQNGCFDSLCVTISETNALPIVNLGADFMSCDTSIALDAGVFSAYNWSTSVTTQTINVNSAGTYGVTVLDANGCENSDQIVVGFYPTLNYDLTTDSSACALATGAAHITNLVGGGGYAINWSTGQVGGLNLLNVASGNYNVNVIDQNGCSLNTPFTIQDNQPVSPYFSATDVSCNNGNDGSITLDSIIGGNAPFVLDWSNGTTGNAITGLSAGTYNVTITGNTGCQAYESFTISNAAPITLNVVTQNSTCTDSNGFATVANLLPTGTYTYQWNDYLAQTADTAFNLPAGNYSVTVTSAAGCTGTASGIVNDLTAATLALTATDATCESQTTGSATVVAAGNGPFSYLWNDAFSQTTPAAVSLTNGAYMVTVTDANGCISIDATNVGFTNSNPSVSLGADTNVCANFYILSPGLGYSTYNWSNGSNNVSISVATAGNYEVTVTDANGCAAADTIALGLNTPIAFTAAETNSTCAANTGSIVLSVLSGGGNYAYNWSTGDTTSSLINLSSGVFNVTISDANGCEETETFNIIQTDAPILSALTENPICNGSADGNISITTFGGTAPFDFAWSNGNNTDNATNLMAGSYTLTVTDDSGCVVLGNYTLSQPAPITIGFSVSASTCGIADGSALAIVNGNQGATTYVWSDANSTDSIYLGNISSGTYSITVTDSAGCSASNAVNVSDFGAAIVTTGSINNNCDNEGFGGAFALASGTGPFNYLWNDANAQTNDTASNLANGQFTVSVTDGNGCLSIANTTVSAFYDAPIISLGADVSTCDGNEVILTPGGGFVAYNWSNGATATDISPVNSGNYAVTVTDVNACSNNDEVIVTFVAPPAVDLGADTLVCLDDATVSIVLEATESFVNYNWNTGDTSSVITISQSGLYSVTVDNGDQCFGSDAIIVVFDSCINVGEDELAGFASKAKLALYPNPNRGSFVLETEGLTTGNYLVRVSSISGQMVEKRNLNIVTGLDSRDEFNLSNAAKGIYILTIEGNEIQLNQRIVIE